MGAFSRPFLTPDDNREVSFAGKEGWRRMWQTESPAKGIMKAQARGSAGPTTARTSTCSPAGGLYISFSPALLMSSSRVGSLPTTCGGSSRVSSMEVSDGQCRATFATLLSEVVDQIIERGKEEGGEQRAREAARRTPVDCTSLRGAR